MMTPAEREMAVDAAALVADRIGDALRIGEPELPELPAAVSWGWEGNVATIELDGGGKLVITVQVALP